MPDVVGESKNDGLVVKGKEVNPDTQQNSDDGWRSYYRICDSLH